MHDPRPVFWLLVAQAILALLLVGWWCTLTPTDRLTRLGAVMMAEHVPTVPPVALLEQPAWLTTHRLSGLHGMAGLLGLALLISAGEGLVRRHQDVLGGFLLTWWTVGVCGVPLVLGGLGGYVVAPWPFPVVWVASGLAVLVSLTTYGLCAGRPYVP